MKISIALLFPLALSPVIQAGPVTAAACVAGCMSLAAGCHATTQVLGPFTLGFLNFAGPGACHAAMHVCSTKCALLIVAPSP